MTNQEDISHYMGLAKDTLLATCAKVRKNLQDLFPEIMILLLVLRKKNFTQMAKYGKHNEHTYRSAFRKGIDWCVYNTKLIRELFDTENDLLAVAIDQSYIRKAGKKTYGIGNYWSGCAQAVKHGCEITLLAIVNATQKDAMAFGQYRRLVKLTDARCRLQTSTSNKSRSTPRECRGLPITW